jgi:ferrous iron transport protein A
LTRAGVAGYVAQLKFVFNRADPIGVRLDAPAAPPLSLAALPIDAAGVVELVEPGSPVSRRLLDLGFVPGTRVRVLRRAPLGDPTVYELRGTQLCLRRSEAARVLVRPLDPHAPRTRGSEPAARPGRP